jgi:hypothetical protein
MASWPSARVAAWSPMSSWRTARPGTARPRREHGPNPHNRSRLAQLIASASGEHGLLRGVICPPSIAAGNRATVSSTCQSEGGESASACMVSM